MKKLLSLEDLYNFYLNQNKSCNFSSKESDSAIFVQIPEVMTFSKDYDPDEFKLKTHLKACHLFENRNGSSIPEDAMKQAIPSFYNSPILGYIHQLSDGSYDFAGHEMTYDSETGETIYKEIPVGVIPESCNAELVYDKENDKTYLEVDGIIFKEYTKASEILSSKGSCKVSVEISVDELSYDSKSKVLNIDAFHFMGVTILGTSDDDEEREVQEGMQGSNITISDFSLNNSLCFEYEQKDKLIETLEKLNTTLESFNININTTKGGNQVKFEELLKKYGKNIEDITFEFEGLSDDELEAAFVEAFGEINSDMDFETKKKVKDDDSNVVDDDEEDSNSGTGSVDSNDRDGNQPNVETPPVQQGENENSSSSNEGTTGEPEENNEEPDANSTNEPGDSSSESEGGESTFTNKDDEEEDSDDSEDDEEDSEEFKCGKKKKKCSIEVGDVKREFSVSMNAKIEAITKLVNDTYADDMVWYCCEIYDDEKKVVMIDYWTGKAYRQSYKVKDDVFTLKGDRVEVYSTWMTLDEQKEFDAMKSKYSMMECELNKYEAEPQKLEVLNSAEYSSIAENEEFMKLKERDTYFNMSLEDLKKKADDIILDCAKKGTLNFSSNSDGEIKKVGVKYFGVNKKPAKRSRYGGLGKKKED